MRNCKLNLLGLKTNNYSPRLLKTSYSVDNVTFRGPKINQVTPKPPWAYCEIAVHIKIRIRREEEETSVLYTRCGSQRGDPASAAGMWGTSTRRYYPATYTLVTIQTQPVKILRFQETCTNPGIQTARGN